MNTNAAHANVRNVNMYSNMNYANSCENSCSNNRANNGRSENVGRCNNFDEIDLPLGMAYVPWQKSWCEVYDISKGFMTGTIFPVLNKPFLGRSGC